MKTFLELNKDSDLIQSLDNSERLKELIPKYKPCDNSPANQAIKAKIEQETTSIHLAVFMRQEEEHREALNLLTELKKSFPLLHL